MIGPEMAEIARVQSDEVEQPGVASQVTARVTGPGEKQDKHARWL
jgi:hypothetical protein